MTHDKFAASLRAESLGLESKTVAYRRMDAKCGSNPVKGMSNLSIACFTNLSSIEGINNEEN